MSRIDLHDLSYLQGGTPRQREAFDAIDGSGVMRDLAATLDERHCTGQPARVQIA